MKDRIIRILMVEDTPGDAELAERELRIQGLKFISLRVDAKETFEKALREFGPDIVLSDYALPSFNGMEALKISLQYDPHLPFIILTGSVNEGTAVDCMKAGSTDYVLKRHLARLPFAVTEAIEKKEALQAQQKAEMELRESEERYRSLFQNNYAAMLIVDPKTADIVDANYSACKYYGWSHQEMITRKLTDIDTSPPTDLYTKMDLARKEAQNSFIFKHLHASGDIRNIYATMGPLSLRSRPLLYMAIHEIIERKTVCESAGNEEARR